MSNVLRETKPFACAGIHLNAPADRMPPGKFPYLLNVRSYQQTTLRPRPGLTALHGAALDQLTVHSIRRLNDPTPFAAAPFARFVGAGTKLYQNSGAAIDTGYSGDPLTMMPIAPEGARQPWMYIADRSRQRKVGVAGTVRATGIAPDNTPPAVSLAAPNRVIIDNLDAVGGWVAVGAYSGALAAVARINTTIGSILYDGGVPGWCSIVPAAFTPAIQSGAVLVINAGGGSAETTVVQDVKRALPATTIGSITYDVGPTGLCTIQAVSDVSDGDVAPPISLRPRPVPGGGYAPASATRRSSFVVDALVLLGGAEIVRILSVTTGLDGRQSFRCVTTGAHAAGEAIAGLASFRCYVTAAHAAAETLTTNCIAQTLTMPVPAVASMTDGIRVAAAYNLAMIGGRATQPDDEIHVSLKVDRLDLIVEGRILFDVDSATNDFLHNYYYAAFRPEDIQRALQGAAGQAVSTVLTAQQIALQRDLIDRGTRIAVRGEKIAYMDGESYEESIPTRETSGASAQAGTGTSQWVELVIKVSDLQRVGADSSRSLANVAGIRLQVTATNTVAVSWDALWIGGNYGPDVGTIGASYLYCSRPRSSTTGAKGNPSPPTRGGVSPHRQRVSVTPVLNGDAQADLQDIFRFGGALASWRWVGAVPNTGAATFSDDYPDDVIAGNETLEFDNFQPWPVSDIVHSGTCNVAGTMVTRTAGDLFDLNWAPYSEIQINGVVYTLYGSPLTNAKLQINENAGTLAGVPFTLPEPLLQGQPLPVLFGDADGYVFGCGDLKNPGRLYWTKRFNPDCARDRDFLDVTSPSEPLQNGFMLDRRPFVFSSDALYPIEAFDMTGAASRWQTPGAVDHHGLWSRWAFAIGDGRCWFLTGDGIRVTEGALSASITDADLYPLFPHDGQPGVAVNGIQPPDMTETTKLRLAYCDGHLYFDYKDALGGYWTLVYDTVAQGWFVDDYTPSILTHYDEEGAAIHAILTGGTTGFSYQMTGVSDAGVAIPGAIWLPSSDQGDGRAQKRYGDAVLTLDPAGVIVTAQLGFDAYATLLAAQALSAVAGRDQQILDCNGTAGRLAQSAGIKLTWSSAVATPIFYFWDLSWQPESLVKLAWHVPPTTHGLSGWQHVRDLYLAYNSNAPMVLTITVDGVPYAYAIPSSAGLDAKYYLIPSAHKGLLHQYDLLAQSEARVFEQDCELRVKAWGSPGAYEIHRLFSPDQVTRG